MTVFCKPCKQGLVVVRGIALGTVGRVPADRVRAVAAALHEACRGCECLHLPPEPLDAEPASGEYRDGAAATAPPAEPPAAVQALA